MANPCSKLSRAALLPTLLSGIYGHAALGRQAFSYTGPPVPIPDGSATGCGAVAVAEITVPQPGNYTLRYFPTVRLFVSHERQGDVVMSLQHVETGTTVLLVDRPGYPAHPLGFTSANFGGLSANNPFIASGYVTRPYEGPFAGWPDGFPDVSWLWGSAMPMHPFLGEISAGRWRLLVSDCAPGAIGSIAGFTLVLQDQSLCYVNCDGSTLSPVLNVNDFVCFANLYAAGDTRANCDASTAPPVLNVNDFSCFQNVYGASCVYP